MSRKYIKQIINQNFIYPNNEVSEYDLDDLVHDINDNSVSGTVSSISATTVTSSQIVLNFSYTWSQNGAEPWVNPDGDQHLISVHMLAEGQDYYKPWRMIGLVASATTGQTSYSGTTSVTATTTNMQVASFTSGVYYLEFRFIGHRAILPVCSSLSINPATPTPTPTQTPTSTATPTPTPTPTQCFECYAYSYTATTSGLLEWQDCDGIMTDVFVNSGETYTIACTGGTNGARVGTVTGDGTIVQGALCSGCPTPTPTPTQTPTPTATSTPGPTPTPTPTPTPASLFELTGCGRSNSNEGGACSDATNNNRTFYSDCDLGNFGAGCFVYEDSAGTIPVAYTYIYIGNLGNYDTDGSSGYVTGASANQC